MATSEPCRRRISVVHATSCAGGTCQILPHKKPRRERLSDLRSNKYRLAGRAATDGVEVDRENRSGRPRNENRLRV